MFEGLNFLFFLLFITGIALLIFSSLQNCYKKVVVDSNCCSRYACIKNSLRNWAIIIVLSVFLWVINGEYEDIYKKILLWSIMLSLITSLCACYVLVIDIVSILSDENKSKKQIIEDKLMKCLLGYLIGFIIFCILALKSEAIISIFSGLCISITFSQYKIFYSLLYLWVYVGMTSYYITLLKRKRQERETMSLDATQLDETINELRTILHRIDLPIAFSFLFFSIVYLFLASSNHKSLDYFVYGAASLHIFSSTSIFLYSYGEEYFDIGFFRFHRY